MKKILLSLALLAGAQALKAQETLPALQKGKWFVETNLSPFSINRTTGFSFASNDGVNEWAVGGEAGFFAADKFAVKIGLGVNGAGVNGNVNGFGGSGETITILNYKIGAKYYVANVLPLQIDFGGLNSEGENATLLGLQAGYAWFVKDNIAIEPAVRYDHGLNDIASNAKTVSVRIGFSLHF